MEESKNQTFTASIGLISLFLFMGWCIYMIGHLTYEIVVHQDIATDSSKTIGYLINKGEYSSVSLNPGNYPPEKSEKRIYVKSFKPVLPTSFFIEDILKEMKDAGHRPAYLRELLFYKIENPDPEETILALGSIHADSAGYSNCPYIRYYMDANKPCYELGEISILKLTEVNNSPFVFLGVKK